MTSFLSFLHGLDRQIADTAALPPREQEEALVALFQGTPRADTVAFVALLIGELVSHRERCAPRRPQRPPAVPAPQPPRAAAQ